MFLSRIERQAFAEFDNWVPDFRQALPAVLAGDDADRVLDDVRARFRRLLDAMPDPGLGAPMQRAFSISGVLYIAVYLVLHERGLDAAQVWSVCEAASRAHFRRMRGVARWIAANGMFSRAVRWLTQSWTKRSRRSAVGGWVAKYVPAEPGNHDFGVDYLRCAIHELALAQGAAEFAPYICLSDIVGSEEFGWGLRRTETLAQGGSRCDFRFRRDKPTDVVRRLPVL